MRHGRAKAARKTLRYFERTVNLKSKPYYSVLLDATFLIAMIRITSNNDEGTTIVSRIERVLQANGGGGTSISGYSRDVRLSGVVGNDDNYSNNNSQSHYDDNNQGPSHHFQRYNVRYFIPEEVVDEIEMILKTFQERSEKTKNKKKQKSYQEKSKVFEDALVWIKKNSNKSRKNTGSKYGTGGRCEVLPKLEMLVETPSKKRKQKQSQETETENDDSHEEEATISATDAVRRHIARDDGREDPETNQTIFKKQQNSVTRTYIVASQEEDLLDELRMLGTVPIMRCTNNASVLILENPSKKGQRTDKGREQTKWKGALQNPAERALVDAAWQAQKKDKIHITGAPATNTSASKRDQNTRAKGPNPLSCKRKRNDNNTQKQQSESKSKKRRARAKRNKEASEAATTSPLD